MSFVYLPSGLQTLFIYLIIYLFIYSLIYLFIYIFIYLFVYLFNYLINYFYLFLFIYLFTYLFIFRYDIMLHCWNEDPLQRPTFTELREHLEEIVSQGDRYFSFDINEENTYYNVASFKSCSSGNEADGQIDDELMQKPIQIKTIEELKKLHEDSVSAKKLQDKPEPLTERYTMPQSLQNGKFERKVSFDMSNSYVNNAFDNTTLTVK